MILRVIRGRVTAGRETDFVVACRQTVVDRGNAPGLVSFFPGYRRVDGAERFILVAMWESSELAEASAGSPESPTARSVLAGVAEVEDVKVYDGIEPAFRGLVDAPGGIVRVSTGTLKPGRRADLTSWLEANGRSVQRVQLVLGYAMGERIIDGRHEMVAISAWPSPLVIEALSEPGGSGGPLFAGAQEFVDDITVEQYQAIGLDLPSRLFDRGARRVLAAHSPPRQRSGAFASGLGRGRDEASSRVRLTAQARRRPARAGLRRAGAR